jgi:hypothetical protein
MFLGEADALLGSRGERGMVNDRYAKLEIAALHLKRTARLAPAANG